MSNRLGVQHQPVTLQGTNISPFKGTFEDDFPFPQVGYVSSLEGKLLRITYLVKVKYSFNSYYIVFCLSRGSTTPISIQPARKIEALNCPQIVYNTRVSTFGKLMRVIEAPCSSYLLKINLKKK